jgi:hypothetical protein
MSPAQRAARQLTRRDGRNIVRGMRNPWRSDVVGPQELDPNACRASFDAATNAAATAIYRKALDDMEFVGHTWPDR